MDPITTALITAIGIGVVAGVTKVAEQSIIDSYNSLKSLIKKKLGQDSEVIAAIDSLESKPESTGRKTTLSEEIEASSIVKDVDTLNLATNLLSLIQRTQSESQHVQSAVGNYIAQADRGGTASVTVGHISKDSTHKGVTNPTQ